MKILFITSTHLGDAILSTGLLHEILKTYPKAHLTIACGPVPAPLFQAIPHLKKCFLIKKKRLSLHWVKLWFQVVGTSWDLVVDLRGTGISHFIRAKQKKIWRSSKAPILKARQIAEWYGLKAPPYNHVWTSPQNKSEASTLLPDGYTYIAFSPTANWDKKCWPSALFSELGQKLIQDHKRFPKLKILILGAPSQAADVMPLVQSLPSKNILNVVGTVSLPTLAECLKRCTLFVGNDSGLMHLAAACGTHTVGLFGPSPLSVYGPWGPHTEAVHLNEPLDKTMKDVQNGIDVMAKITVDEVLNAIHNLI